jgi:hypothetical protein
MLTRCTDENGKPAEAEARRGQSADSSPSVPHLVTCLKLCGEAGIWPCTCNMQVWHGLDYMCVTAMRPGSLGHCYHRLRRRAGHLRGSNTYSQSHRARLLSRLARSRRLVSFGQWVHGGSEVRGRFAADTDQAGIHFLLLKEVLQPLSIGLRLQSPNMSPDNTYMEEFCTR